MKKSVKVSCFEKSVDPHQSGKSGASGLSCHEEVSKFGGKFDERRAGEVARRRAWFFCGMPCHKMLSRK